MKTNDIEYINELSAKEITFLSEQFKNSNKRKEQKWYLNKKIKRKIIGQNLKIYEFTIYQYYYFIGKNKKYISYYPEKYKYLINKSYDLKLILETFYLYCGLIRNKFVKISWNLCKYYAKKLNLFNEENHTNIKQYASEIYIHIDDCYDKTRVNKKVIKSNTKIIKINSNIDNKVIYTYENYTAIDNEKIANISRAKIIIELIKKHYFIDSNTKLYLLSDGAKYFQNLAKILNATHIYDYFHFIKKFNDIFMKRIYIYNKYKKEILKINGLSVQKWLKLSLSNKDELLEKLNYLLKLKFSKKSISITIKAFINFIKNSCSNYKFYINNITAQSESAVSLYKSFYSKRYSTFSVETIQNLIKIQASEKWIFINFKSMIKELNLNVLYEPLLWEVHKNNIYL
ncbi:Uncharacterised protein (plasmid) [Mycoplasmopsis maculosa]|uniref:Uncharacterized protein n=1 Tax=Mycoplasmopsis maculosa TaxID=114885 RepID=A0A449B5F1_9BACT|nr:hypothetical protein [Mycoplasmopsis maculosa]VEU75310.1 Uncharacterised protein [Mycoplasmopsis maculosa]VEU75833.1 Uncharacterised protein [Mycoplasmopsis maculosa]